MSDKRIEWQDARGTWVRGDYVPTTYGRGYLDRHAEEPGPRLAARLVDPASGKVIVQVSERHDLSIGAHVGFPESAQYVHAATRALRGAIVVTGREGRRKDGQRTDDIRANLRRAVDELRTVLDKLDAIANATDDEGAP